MKNTSHCWNHFVMPYCNKYIQTLVAFVIISLVRSQGHRKAEKRPKTDLGRLRENVIFFFPRGEKQMTVCCCCLLSVLLCCTLLLFSNLVDSRMASVQSPSASKPKGRYCCVPGCHSNEARDRHLSFYRFPKANETQRLLWIRAVHRKNPDGSDWKVTSSTRICSPHVCCQFCPTTVISWNILAIFQPCWLNKVGTQLAFWLGSRWRLNRGHSWVNKVGK